MRKAASIDFQSPMMATQASIEELDSDNCANGLTFGKPQAFVVVIPAFNESASIRDVVVRALRQVSWVIVVDDGSNDGTAAALEGLPVTVVRNARNRGKAASLRRGMELALRNGVSAVITLDGDAQHEPEDIPRLIAACLENRGAIVIGARLHERSKIPRARYLANRFANFCIAWAAGCPFDDSQSGFRIYPASLLHEIDVSHNRSTRFVFESEILIDAARAGSKIIAVPIAAIYHARARPSHFRPVVDIMLITRMVAWKVLSRGLCVPGLIRNFRRRDCVQQQKTA